MEHQSQPPLPSPTYGVWMPWREVEPRPLRQGRVLHGYSVASLRTHWYLEPDLMIDAGLSAPFQCTVICLTHTHADHIANLHTQLYHDKKTTVFCHEAVRPYVEQLLDVWAMATTGIPNTTYDRDRVKVIGVVPGETPPEDIMLRNMKHRLHFFQPDHTEGSVAYGLSECRKRLSSALQGLPSREIAALAKQGVETREEYWVDHVVFWGDTTHVALETNPEARRYATHVIECTFLEPSEEVAAEQKKHMHWKHLRPWVEAWSECEFVLTHFSQRYRHDQVERFRETVPANAVVWNNAR